jgi:hypothetical protein
MVETTHQYKLIVFELDANKTINEPNGIFGLGYRAGVPTLAQPLGCSGATATSCGVGS